MKDINIKINRKTRFVYPEKDNLGNELENLQEKLIFTFEDEFVDGQAELIYGDENYVAYPEKIEESYVLPVKEIMLKQYGEIYMQLKITEGTDEEEIPKFRSNVFPMYCGKSLVEEIPEPEQYPSWLDKANAKLNQLDKAIDKCVEQGDYAKEQGDYAKNVGNDLETKRDSGYFKGEKGDNGKDALINGVNTITINAGTNISLDQQDGVLTINNTYSDEDIQTHLNSLEELTQELDRDLSNAQNDIEHLETTQQGIIEDVAQISEDLELYALVNETGNKIEFDLDTTTFKLKAKLKNKNGVVINTSNEIDLPLESLVLNVTYDNSKKELVITLQNGTITHVPVGELISGLVSDTELNQKLTEYVKNEELENYVDNEKFDAGLQTRMTTDMENIDEAGIEKIDEIVNDKGYIKLDKIEPIIPKKEAIGTNTLEYDNALEFEVFSSEINGNVEQETTTGKNLANIYNIENINTNYKMAITNDTIVLSDNTSINGYSATNKTLKEICPNLKVDDVVYLRFNTTSVETNKNNIWLTAPASILWVKDTSKTITQDMLNSVVVLYGGSGGTAIISNFMITKENNDTYEPYTNGASPNPDYPQEIETLKPYNLFDENQLLNASGWTKNNNGFYNGTVDSYYSKFKDKFNFNEEFKVNTSYTLKLNYYTTGGTPRIKIAYTDNTTATLNLDKTILTSLKYTTSNTKTISKIYSDFGSGSSQMLFIKDFIIYEGTTEKPYLPYGAIGVKRVGKNLVNVPSVLTFTRYTLLEVSIPAGTYHITNTSTQSSDGSYDIRITFNDSGVTKMIQQYKNIIITLPKDETKIYLYAKGDYAGSAGITATINNLMISKDGGEYVPYKEKIQYIDLAGNELLTTDKLITDYKGNAYIEKKYGKLVLDGSEDWMFNNSLTTPTNRTVIQLIEYRIKNENSLSNYFKFTTLTISNKFIKSGIYLYMSIEDSIVGITSSDTEIQKTNKIKQWLKEKNESGEPVFIIYELETPEIIELPKVEPVKSLEGYNHVEVLATLEPSSMKETYAVDLQAEIEELKQALLSTGANL